MFMRHPAYLGEDSGSQAIAGEFSRILEQFWSNPKIVSQTVSHWLSEPPKPLLHSQMELEARVGIEPYLIWQIRKKAVTNSIFQTHSNASLKFPT
jgi:hypothetical protein